MGESKQRKLCRSFLEETFGNDGFNGYFELWTNHGKNYLPNGTYYVWHAPYVTNHDETTFICVGETYDEAKEKAMSQLSMCKTVKNVDFAFSLCEVETYKGYTIIFN